MRIIPTKKFSGAIRSEKGAVRGISRYRGFLPRDERGQGFLEYVLVLMVVLGMIFVMARPVIARLQKTFEKGMKGSIFKDDPTGSNFYYFPVSRK